ncbi:MAG: radical SAM protein, partial [Thermoplasmata archaeon]
MSEGWNLNFAVGCTHACPFCYVDSIHKRFGNGRYGDIVQNRWGNYFLIPENLDEAIERTPWHKWAGKEVMMSSTHDPYLPKLVGTARKILEHALPAGVRICLQTRSFLVTKDLDYLAQYKDQIRLQVSIATLSRDLARKIEPRVPSPEARLEVMRRAKELGLPVGVILAPIFPPMQTRPDFVEDL